MKQDLLNRVHAKLLPSEPSYNLMREVFNQHVASVGQLAGEGARMLTPNPEVTFLIIYYYLLLSECNCFQEVRSRIILSGVPSKSSPASLNEYCNATGIHWDTAKAHRVHRDEAKVTSCLMCACLILIATA